MFSDNSLNFGIRQITVNAKYFITISSQFFNQYSIGK